MLYGLPLISSKNGITFCVRKVLVANSVGQVNKSISRDEVQSRGSGMQGTAESARSPRRGSATSSALPPWPRHRSFYFSLTTVNMLLCPVPAEGGFPECHLCQLKLLPQETGFRSCHSPTVRFSGAVVNILPLSPQRVAEGLSL